MKLSIVLLLSMLAVPAYADTEEFSVTMSAGNNTVQLAEAFTHFAISSSAALTVRFVMPNFTSAGALSGISRTPAGGTAVADSGPHPDLSDTTLYLSDTEPWNVFNDVSAKKLIIHGAAGGETVVIRMKR